MARHIPSVVLAVEFILGGIGRISPFPFPGLHARIIEKNKSIAPLLYPIIPCRDVKSHNIYVGIWMVATGLLLFHPNTRGKAFTLGCVLFWTGAGGYSQYRAGMPFWLPVLNAMLGGAVYFLEQ